MNTGICGVVGQELGRTEKVEGYEFCILVTAAEFCACDCDCCENCPTMRLSKTGADGDRGMGGRPVAREGTRWERLSDGTVGTVGSESPFVEASCVVAGLSVEPNAMAREDDDGEVSGRERVRNGTGVQRSALAVEGLNAAEEKYFVPLSRRLAGLSSSVKSSSVPTKVEAEASELVH